MSSVRILTSSGTMRRYILLIIVCTLLGFLFFVYLQYSETGVFPSLRKNGEHLLLAVAVTNVVGLLIFQLDKLLDRMLSWRNRFMLRFLVGFIVHLASAIAIINLSSQYIFKSGTQELIKLCVLFSISVFIYEIFYGLFYSYRYYAHTQVEQLRSERWQLELQFESLKTQISPHYLFNCLNTISSLLYKDSHIAEKFIRRMADTFRYVLSNQKKN